MNDQYLAKLFINSPYGQIKVADFHLGNDAAYINQFFQHLQGVKGMAPLTIYYFIFSEFENGRETTNHLFSCSEAQMHYNVRLITDKIASRYL